MTRLQLKVEGELASAVMQRISDAAARQLADAAVKLAKAQRALEAAKTAASVAAREAALAARDAALRNVADLAVKAAKAEVIAEKALMAARVAARAAAEEEARRLHQELVDDVAVAKVLGRVAREAAEAALTDYLNTLKADIDAAEKAARASYDSFRATGRWLLDLPGRIRNDIEAAAQKLYFGFINSIGYPGF